MKKKHWFILFSFIFAVSLWTAQKFLIQKKQLAQHNHPLPILNDNVDQRAPSSAKINLKESSHHQEESLPLNIKKFESRLLKELSLGHSIKFDEIEERKITKNGRTNNYSFVKVEITSPEGIKSYFNAQVDAETGNMVHSWNKTRHELKKGPFLTHPEVQ